MRWIKMPSLSLSVVSLMAGWWVACGAGAPVEPSSQAAKEVQPERTVADDGLAVEGLLGTIDQADVDRVFQSRMSNLLACYEDTVEEELEEIEGHLELSMRIDTSGRADRVYIRTGDVGSSRTESCILKKIETFSFPKAVGGYADVSFSFDLQAPYEHPPFVSISEPDLQDVLSENAADISGCLAGQGGVTITAYVGKGGRVLSSGAAASTFEGFGAATCLAPKVLGWNFPDPGRKLAKVELSF